jgi:hypothetical protein
MLAKHATDPALGYMQLVTYPAWSSHDCVDRQYWPIYYTELH